MSCVCLAVSLILCVWLIILIILVFVPHNGKISSQQSSQQLVRIHQNMARINMKYTGHLSNSSPVTRNVDRKVNICYINLDHRRDRLNHMQHNMLPYFEKHSESIHRISAIQNKNGAKGCSLSHIKAMQFALDNGFEHLLVFEDDATIKKSDSNKQDVVDKCMAAFKEVKSTYDVFVLGSIDVQRVIFPKTLQSLVNTVVLSGGSHAYIIHRTYIPVLLEIYRYSAQNLSKTLVSSNYHTFALDQLHKNVQTRHLWYAPNNNDILQLPVFSDISKNTPQSTYGKALLKYKIPFCIFTFWIGGKPMSNQRHNAFLHMHTALNVPIVHITEHNLAKYTLWPVHPAVQYLSGIHKSDYFRIYFLLHIGGGYFDIKHPTETWDKYFSLFEDPDVWVVGVPEEKIGMAKSPNVNYNESNYKKCITNSCFISRKNNPIMREIHDMQHMVLDSHLEKLKTNPPPSDRYCFNHENGYPLRWAELLGELTSQVVPKYFDKHVKAVIQKPDVTNYL